LGCRPALFCLPGIWALSAWLGLSLTLAIAGPRASASADPQLQRIQANSNQAPAGTLADGVLTLELEAREGEWFPENERGPSLKVFAFGERGKPLQVPGPLIRVREGSTIRLSIHNLLAAKLAMHGMHARPGKPEDVLEIPSGETRELKFAAGTPGAYYYWATAGGDTWNGRGYKEDSQLSGGFLVDPAGDIAPDRIFMITMWRDRQLVTESMDVPAINGKSFPYTERLEYTAGTDVRWRWLNASPQIHPMHLHGSYFRVDAIGDAESETILAPEQRKLVSTQLMPIGGTMTTYWQPSEPGRWLFHCHILVHVSPDADALRHGNPEPAHPSHDDPVQHMSGLVLGITVNPRPGELADFKPPMPKRKIDLVIGPQSGGINPSGYAMGQQGKPTGGISAPGPTLVLTRGEPVAIHVTNHLSEPTAVHWHAIELQSYYDGVPGWTGHDKQVTPMIPPGKSFDVYFTPPRAGTFIYHTHMNDLVQMASGLYGPLIVLPPGETFQPETDNIFLISRHGTRKEGELLLNGAQAPEARRWRIGRPCRLRFINISPNNSVKVALTQIGEPVAWTSLAKDGADLPPAQAVSGPASFLIAPGETYDFQVRPEREGEMELTFELPLLKERITQSIRVEGAAK
jgi:manganese oxidase